MSRRPARFTQADLTRAAKAAQKAGLVVEVRADGVIRLVRPDAQETRDSIPFEERPAQPLC